MKALQYPIGEFVSPDTIGKEKLKAATEIIETFPDAVQAVLNEAAGRLEQMYRPGGWNIRQLVNHCADSHMNAYIRFKLALTEENPTIKPYEEAAWAELADYDMESVSQSLLILKGVHARWVKLLNSLSQDQLEKAYFHPASKEYITLEEAVLQYEWHCKHHLAHMHIALDTPVLS